MQTQELFCEQRGWLLSWHIISTQVHYLPVTWGQHLTWPSSAAIPGSAWSKCDSEHGQPCLTWPWAPKTWQWAQPRGKQPWLWLWSLHAQGHLWVSQSTFPFPQCSSQWTCVPGIKEKGREICLSLCFSAHYQLWSVPQGTHLCTPLSLGSRPAAPSEAFVNSGSLSCFLASINIQVLLQWGKILTFIKHLL